MHTADSSPGFLISNSLTPAPLIGASGSIFGLLAALIVYRRKRGGTAMTMQLRQWAAIMFAMGFFMSGVNNFAHAGGFAGGWVTAEAMRFSEKRESRGVQILALALLAYSIRQLPPGLPAGYAVDAGSFWLGFRPGSPPAGWTTAVREKTPLGTVLVVERPRFHAPAFTGRTLFAPLEVAEPHTGYNSYYRFNLVDIRGYPAALWDERQRMLETLYGSGAEVSLAAARVSESVAVATVLFPSLSRLAARADLEERERRLAERGSSVDEERGRLAALQSEVEAAQAYVSERQTTLEARLAEVKEGDRERQRAASDLSKQASQLADREKKLAELRAMLHGLPAGETAVFMDEVDVNLNPKVGCMWMKRGEQATVETPGTNEKRYLAGSIHWRTGRVILTEGKAKEGRSAALFLRHLDDLRRAFRRGGPRGRRAKGGGQRPPAYLCKARRGRPPTRRSVRRCLAAGRPHLPRGSD